MLTSKHSLGWAVDRALSGDERGKGRARLRPDEDNCGHHHKIRSNLVENGSGMIRRHLSKSSTLTWDYCRFPMLIQKRLKDVCRLEQSKQIMGLVSINP